MIRLAGVNRDCLIELKAHSLKVGMNLDLVQASGGNTSGKDGHRIWVKGSGKRLKDALSEEIFALINSEKLSDTEILSCEDFSNFTTNSILPSIEANFHIFLKSKFVTHLHSLSSIALGVTFKELREPFLDKDVHFIPYARPGIALVNEINGVENCSGKILVLQNHGVIFSGQSCNEIEVKIEKFELLIRNHFEQLPLSNVFPNWVDILTSGVLTPDEAVFLGETPFMESESFLNSSVGINSRGELLFSEKYSADRIELARFYVRVAKLIEGKASVTYLPQSEISDLLGWDREKKRIEMSK